MLKGRAKKAAAVARRAAALLPLPPKERSFSRPSSSSSRTGPPRLAFPEAGSDSASDSASESTPDASEAEEDEEDKEEDEEQSLAAAVDGLKVGMLVEDRPPESSSEAAEPSAPSWSLLGSARLNNQEMYLKFGNRAADVDVGSEPPLLEDRD